MCIQCIVIVCANLWNTICKIQSEPAIYSSPRLYYTKYCRRVSVARHSLNVNEEYNFNNIYVLYLTLYHHVYSVNLRYISCSEWCSVAENHLLRLQPIILGAAHLRGENSKHTNKQTNKQTEAIKKTKQKTLWTHQGQLVRLILEM